jgi:flagellin
MRLTINPSASTAARTYTTAAARVDDSVARMASGSRINSATDDAAGLVVSNRLRAQVSGLRQAMRNTQEGISITQIVDNALGQLADNLQRLRDLTVQAANTAVNDIAARTGIQSEMDGLIAAGQQVIAQAKYGSQPLFEGYVSSFVDFHVGSGATSNDRVVWQVTPMAWEALWSPAVNSPSFDPEVTTMALDNMHQALWKRQFETGALRNQFEHILATLTTAADNLSWAESQLRDVDMATEMTALTTNQIVRDASSSMLAQTGRIHENLLGLLQT